MQLDTAPTQKARVHIGYHTHRSVNTCAAVPCKYPLMHGIVGGAMLVGLLILLQQATI